MSRKEIIARLIEDKGGRFSVELGIDLMSGSSKEIFKWFLASLLFGARIRQDIAIKTYHALKKQNALTPHALLKKGWDDLVEILDEGGYARYDFKTATKLLDISGMITKKYSGNLNLLHEEARDPRDLESKLMEWKGVGPVTVNIFLRELRGIWKKADPLPGSVVIQGAQRLGLISLEGRNDEEREKILRELERIWEEVELPYRFSDFEAALVRFGIDSRRTGQKRN